MSRRRKVEFHISNCAKFLNATETFPFFCVFLIPRPQQHKAFVGIVFKISHLAHANECLYEHVHISPHQHITRAAFLQFVSMVTDRHQNSGMGAAQEVTTQEAAESRVRNRKCPGCGTACERRHAYQRQSWSSRAIPGCTCLKSAQQHTDLSVSLAFNNSLKNSNKTHKKNSQIQSSAAKKIHSHVMHYSFSALF